VNEIFIFTKKYLEKQLETNVS